MRPLLRRCAVLITAAALAATGVGAPSPAAADEPFPDFVFQGIITDKASMIYNPTDEYIFPSIFHAGAHLDDPLGEWYLYLAPHDPPAGIMLMYSDSLDGPWTEFPDNPIIATEWEPHYSVSHVSSPDALWHEQTGEVFLYFHGENSETRYATSTDGVHFEYGDIAVDNGMGGPGVTESSYARVFDHPDPDSEYVYGMLYMANYNDDRRRLRYAESFDGIDWDIRPDPVVEPEDGDSGNVSGGNLWQWGDQLYIIYHNSTGNVMARPVDPTLTEVGPSALLHSSSGVGEDVGRTAAPDIVTEGEHTYLFYEAGHRLGATIAYAKAGPGVEFPDGPEPIDWPTDPDNPVFEQCAAPGSDEFDGDTVSADWDRVVRGEDARHQVADGALTIPTYLGGVAAAPLLQQELPEGPWQVTTKLHIEATQRFQQGACCSTAPTAPTASSTWCRRRPGYGWRWSRWSGHRVGRTPSPRQWPAPPMSCSG
ncbi:hypothetical protein JQS43_10755 [Natronosporangium hydrolyticum]|uniref:Glycosyl hydrolase family 32 N-terminal domain-containing protein n=1 Tax=Natronosporangium hydrolyticum TaxID=2811111 RepID=A0A895YML6_9ACTN|nr:hypothetical protein [Natronosporangium hydrolyticum]QSB16709.1 hypothetical protein JQS43_10755 [Natronosporangium hydrolyticum]